MNKLSEALTAAGRTPSPCPCCGRVFDPASSYAGHPGSRRKWCSTECRDLIQRDRKRSKRKHRKQWASLIALHEQESAGQLSLDPSPLPPVPELQTDDEPA